MTRVEIKKGTFNTCGYCGHSGPDVNAIGHEHIGGKGAVEFPICDNAQACIARKEGKLVLVGYRVTNDSTLNVLLN